MRWLAAGECSPCVDIDDSSELTRIFENVAKLCFESCMLRKGCKWPNTPLSLVFLMKELATKLASGGTYDKSRNLNLLWQNYN